MKKRILALALAGTTAFSVFGGLNVFAAYSWDTATPAYDDNFKGLAAASPTLVSSGFDTFADIEKISFEDVTADSFEYAADTYYVADWKVKGSEAQVQAFEKAVKDAITAGESAWPGTHKTSINAALADAYTTDTTSITMKDATSKDSALIDAYAKMVTNYSVVKDYLNTSHTTDPDKVDDTYDLADFDLFDAEDLFDAIYTSYNKAAYADTLSYYTYLNNEYDRIIGLVEKADMSDAIDTYEHFLEAATTLTESDYSPSNWASIEYKLRLAEVNADAGKYVIAAGYLKEALDTTPEKGDYTALRDTLMSMYADSKGQTRSSYIKETYDGATYAVYDKGDYTIKAGTYTDEWNALFVNEIWYYNPLDAVAADDASSEYTYDGIYGYAYALYNEARSGKVAQSRLDVANDMLTEAIAALDPTTSSTAWELVKLEKTVELAETLVDTDFNSGSTKWKTFTSNLEKAQEVLSKDNASKSEVTNAINALNASMIALKDIAKNPSYTLKKEFNAVLKEAKDALKELDDQNATQYKTLMTAINDANELGSWLDVNETAGNYVKLVSDYEEAIANLEAAIAGYVHPQGWYQDDKGTWFYGVGTENYTGWLELNGRTYFLKDDGSMAASTWVKTEKGYWYYLNASGAMLHDGWAKINDTWYFFKNFGGMAEGWVKDGNTWYYLTPGSGAMVSNGWSLINGKYYYFTESGAMLANTTTPDGYKVDASGAWVK